MVNDLSVAPLVTTGLPRVEVLFEDIDDAVDSVTITRTAAGRSMDVRGAIRRTVAGALTLVDAEFPFNVPVQYRVEMFNSVGVPIGFSDPFTLQVDSDVTWMHNPLDPDGGVVVEFTENSAQSISRPIPGGVVFPKGRRVGVMVAGPRQGVRGVVLDVRCETTEDADKVQAFLGDYTTTTVPTICVRMGGLASQIRLPQPLFLGVLDIADESMNIPWGGTDTVQRIQGDEVAPPAPGIFIPLLTRADLNAYYATRAELNADHASRLDVNRFYAIAGFADA